MRKSILIGAVAILALVGAAFVAAPAYVQHRVVEEATAHGVNLTVHDTRLGLDGIRLDTIVATTARVPNARLRANEIFASWDASDVRLSGGELTLDGPVTPPTGAAVEENPVPAAGPTSIHVDSTRIVWTHVAGNASVDIGDVSGTFGLAPHLGDSFDVQGNATLAAAGVTMGPFQARISRDLAGEHARVALDPADTMANVFSLDKNGDTLRTEWVVQKRATSKLGVPLAALGIQLASDPVVDLHIVDSVTRPATGSATATGSFSFATDAITLPQQKDPMAVSISLSWKGNADAKMPIDAGKFQAGPFNGTVTGTITRPIAGFAVDLAVLSNTVPCDKFVSGDVTSLVNGAMGGGLGGALGGSVADILANAGGVQTKVLGTVKIAGNIRFDSQNPGARELSVAPQNDCKVQISAGQ